MNVSSIGFNPIPPAAAGGDQQAQVQARAHAHNDDHDQDDTTVQPSQAVQPSPPSQGTGQIVDKTV